MTPGILQSDYSIFSVSLAASIHAEKSLKYHVFHDNGFSENYEIERFPLK